MTNALADSLARSILGTGGIGAGGGAGGLQGIVAGLFGGGTSAGAAIGSLGGLSGAGSDVTYGFQNLTVGMADGINLIPHDAIVKVHAGEAIQPKKYNPAAGGALPQQLPPINITMQIDARTDAAQIAQVADQATRNAVRAVFEEMKAQGRNV
jgi:hypothetical protein